MGSLICQVARVGVDQLTCPHRESGGVQCEVIGSHDRHRVGEHTIQHYHWGNGWSCTNIENTVRKLNESMEQFSRELADDQASAG